MTGNIRARRRIGRTLHGLVATAAMVGFGLTTHAAAQAGDVVLEWNQIALAATVTANQGPVPQIRSMAIAQVSVHDAVNAITRDYETYLDIGRRPWGVSADAAAIGAAHYALVNLFPPQASALNTARAASLAARGLSESDPGIRFGEAVAAVVLKRRSTDGSAQAQFPYTAPGAGAPGIWVATSSAPALLPGWGSVTPWVIRKAAHFRPDGPPSLRSRRYARDYNEVKEMGSLTSETRTAEETEIGRFWLAPPSVIWNGVARQMIVARQLDPSAAARALALVYLAAADASIVCWDAKYTFNFWRPITAIHQGDADGNDRTSGDPTWAPLFPTPPHPDYLSGHATNSSAMATILRTLFGDRPEAPIVATSPTNPGFERRWESFSEGVEEVIDARIFSGIHYRSADEDGAHVGRAVARYVMSRQLRPFKDRER
jgi:hypothetical protein